MPLLNKDKCYKSCDTDLVGVAFLDFFIFSYCRLCGEKALLQIVFYASLLNSFDVIDRVCAQSRVPFLVGCDCYDYHPLITY